MHVDRVHAANIMQWPIHCLLMDLRQAGEPWVTTETREHKEGKTIRFVGILSTPLDKYITASSFGEGRLASQRDVKILRRFLDAYDGLMEAATSFPLGENAQKYIEAKRREFAHYNRTTATDVLSEYIAEHMRGQRVAYVTACNEMNLCATRWAWARRELKRAHIKCTFSRLEKKAADAPTALAPLYTRPFV